MQSAYQLDQCNAEMVKFYSRVNYKNQFHEFFEKITPKEAAKRSVNSQYPVDENGNFAVKQKIHCISVCRLPIENDESEPNHTCFTCFRKYLFNNNI